MVEIIKVGDLVRWKPNLPFVYKFEYGIVIEIIDGYLVGVLWAGSHHVYMEAINNLEVINEETSDSDRKGDISEE